MKSEGLRPEIGDGELPGQGRRRRRLLGQPGVLNADKLRSRREEERAMKAPTPTRATLRD